MSRPIMGSVGAEFPSQTGVLHEERIYDKQVNIRETELGGRGGYTTEECGHGSQENKLPWKCLVLILASSIVEWSNELNEITKNSGW